MQSWWKRQAGIELEREPLHLRAPSRPPGRHATLKNHQHATCWAQKGACVFFLLYLGWQQQKRTLFTLMDASKERLRPHTSFVCPGRSRERREEIPIRKKLSFGAKNKVLSHSEKNTAAPSERWLDK
jgi:hypothetical protein